ncbi:AAA family ATPase [uncultured Alistipes sp.]|uniref:AAA family ATPase n=2 Tax=Alistipes TaxID=239759 RepID=UPI00322065FE
MGFVDDCIMSKPEQSAKIDISALIIDLSERVPDPQPIVRIRGNLIASRGNVSAVVGLAKSRKTFLTCAVASGFLSDSEFMGFDTPATGKVVYIDTEQSKAHVHKIARRILRSIGLPTDRNHDKLIVAALRELTPDQRKEVTSEILRRYKPDLLILDGVADLCNDPNDLHESEALTCELMRWSSEYDNHILCVLHSNPGGEKARGHLGSALLRKAETVMLVKADSATSVVSPQYCRNEPFSEFAFQINAAGLPEPCGLPAPQPKEDVFAEVMESGKVYSHSELAELIRERLNVKESGAKMKISRAVKAGNIVKNQAGGYYLPGSQVEVSQPELHDEPF